MQGEHHTSCIQLIGEMDSVNHCKGIVKHSHPITQVVMQGLSNWTWVFNRETIFQNLIQNSVGIQKQWSRRTNFVLNIQLEYIIPSPAVSLRLLCTRDQVLSIKDRQRFPTNYPSTHLNRSIIYNIIYYLFSHKPNQRTKWVILPRDLQFRSMFSLCPIQDVPMRQLCVCMGAEKQSET